MEENNTYKEKILDYLLDVACSDEEILDDIEDNCKEINFSSEHQAKMKKVFEKVRRKEIINKTCRSLKAVASIVVISIIILGITTISVEAYRVKFMNYISEYTSRYTEFSNNIGSTEKYYDSNIKNIKFNYIPNGFKLVEGESTETDIYMEFAYAEKYFILEASGVEGTIRIDTENSQIENIIFNNIEYTLINKDNRISVFWMTNKMSYYLIGNIDKQEMIKIIKEIEEF